MGLGFHISVWQDPTNSDTVGNAKLLKQKLPKQDRNFKFHCGKLKVIF